MLRDAFREMVLSYTDLVVEQGVARAWEMAPGDTLQVGRAGGLRVVGVVVSPDNEGAAGGLELL